MATFVTQIGEGFAGTGPDAAHVNTVLGVKGGAVETAWVTALASPTQGHVPFVATVQPNVPVKPMTLFVNKASIVDVGHGNLTWGAAQAGVATGVLYAVRDGLVDRSRADDLLLIVAVWVSPDARDATAVFVNNRAATLHALRAGADAQPGVETVLEAIDEPGNAYFTPEGPLPPFER